MQTNKAPLQPLITHMNTIPLFPPLYNLFKYNSITTTTSLYPTTVAIIVAHTNRILTIIVAVICTGIQVVPLAIDTYMSFITFAANLLCNHLIFNSNHVDSSGHTTE